MVTALTAAAAGVIAAPPAAAALTPGTNSPLLGGTTTVGGVVTSVVNNHSAVPTFTNDEATGTTTVFLPGGTSGTPSRTIIRFGTTDVPGFDVAMGQKIEFVFADAQDTVAIQTTGRTGVFSTGTEVEGVIRGSLGSVGGSYGGNIWFLNPGGAFFRPPADVQAGGLLVTSGQIADVDLLDGSPFAFAGATGDYDQGFGTTMRAHGGYVALLNDGVETATNSLVSAEFGNASRGEILLGTAKDFTLETIGLDIHAYTPAGASSGSLESWPFDINGTVDGEDVYLAGVGGNLPPTWNYDAINPDGPLADDRGDLVVTAGLGLVRPPGTTPSGNPWSMSARPVPGLTPQNLSLTAPISNAGDLVLAASGDLTLGAAATLSAPTLALSAGDTFTNQGAALATGQWVVYADDPAVDVVGGGNSNQRALWNADIGTHPRTAITGNRYVFRWAPDITVTAVNTSKVFDAAFTAGQQHPLQATVSGPPHPGVPGLFAADSAPTFTGGPSLSSLGRPHTAPERPGGYPLLVATGDLSSPTRYDFVLVDGTLTVDDQTPPTVTPTLTGTTPGDDGWYRSDMSLSWAVTDIGTVPTSITRGAGCATQSFTSDVDTSVTCVAGSLGGTTTVTQAVKRDATAPGLTIDGLLHPSGDRYTAGTWTNQDVEVFYTCAGAVSGVASMTVNRSGANRMTESGDADGRCTDNAGNSTFVPFRVDIDKAGPTIGDEELRTADANVYEPGTWVDQAVRLTWTCADEGGSGVVAATGQLSTDTRAALQGECRDTAGNVVPGRQFDVRVDLVDPSIVNPTLASGGTSYTPGTWARGPVTVTYGCADAPGGSGPTQPGGSGTLTVTGTLTANCEDAAGNDATETFDVTIDDQPPVIGGVTLQTSDRSAYSSGDWTTRAVTLSWTCTDGAGQSGATAAGGELTATTTGALRPVCSDVAGNSVQGELFQANIDGVDPTIVDATLTTGDGPYTAGTWARGPVTLTYGCADTGGSGPASAGASETTGTTGTLLATCTDRAGNEVSRSFEVTIDGTDPLIQRLEITSDGRPYTPGAWTRHDVVLTWECADGEGSGALPPDSPLTRTGTGPVQVACEDTAGNAVSSDVLQINIDKVDPTIVEPALTSGGIAYEDGAWARGPVTLTYRCEDTGGSGPATTDVLRDTATVSGTLTAGCSDVAGNTVTRSFPVAIDGAAPTIGGLRLETADGTAYVSGDWTDQAVTLSWTCTDDTAGSGAMKAADSATAESTQGLRAVCSDVAGNSAQGELFQAAIDTVDPVLTVPASQTVSTTGDSAVVSWAAPSATDDEDADVDVVCTPGSGGSFPVGTTTVTCTATDHAGNTDTGQFTVTVTREAPVSVTFLAPIDAPPVINTSVRNGVVPVRLTASGVPVPTGPSGTPLATGTPVRVTCPAGARSDAVETYTSRWRFTTNLFFWDARKENWVAKVNTRGFVRNACYRVPVEHGGTLTGLTATGGSEVGFFYLRSR